MSGGPYGRGKAPERACRKLKDWPAADRALWLAVLAPGDLLDEGGSRSGLRPRSNAKVEKGYGRWLTFLVTSGLPLDGPPAERITPERVAAYVAHLQDLGNGSQTCLCRLQELADMAEVLAPERDWSFLARLASRIRARHQPARDKQQALVMTDELFDLGLDLMERARSASTPRRAASLFRDGLLIALLALEPLRRRNIAALDLGRSLLQEHGTWVIALQPDQTKTHAPLESLWPEVLVPALEEYLAVHRPFLCSCTGRWSSPVAGALWVSTDGSPMTEMAIYDRVRLHTKEAFGRPVNPHLFRDAAATTLAIEDPQAVRAAAPLLGHRSFTTTERHYRHAQRRTAHQRYLEAIEQARRRD